MSEGPPTPSRFSIFALLFALAGVLVGLGLSVTVVFGGSLPSDLWWTLALGGLGGLTLWGLVGLALNVAAGGRVLWSRRPDGVPLAVGGLAASLLIAAPGVTLVTLVAIVLALLFSGAIGFGNPGRPLRLEGRPWAGGLGIRGWRRPTGFRPRVAAAWVAAARAEHSAVGAFRQLTREVDEHGGPPSLRDRCAQAAVEEAGHARRCADLATRFGGLELQFPVLPTPAPRPLAEVAVSSLVDGVVGEGFAAAVAARATTEVDDEEVAELLETIARDEASHARLSRDLVRWCLRTGGPAVASALAAARVSPPRPMATEPLAGGIGARLQRRLARRVVRRAVRAREVFDAPNRRSTHPRRSGRC